MFITVEGPNGIGKSSLVQNIVERLQSYDYNVYQTKEPTQTKLGQFIREMENEIKGIPYAYLIAADRYIHIINEIEKKLQEGFIVISDRYVLSSIVLQQLDGLDMDFIWFINQFSITPCLTVLLTGNPDIITERLNKRANRTRLETQNSSWKEIELYNRGMEYLKGKNYKFMVLDNTANTIFYNSKVIENYIITNMKE